MVYVISIIVACTICVSLRYLENKRINDPYHSSNKSSDNLYYTEEPDVKQVQKSRKTAAGHICYRRRTTEEWKEVNPVLGDGEIVYDSTINAFKVGDGKKAFMELDYISGCLGLYGDTSDMK